MFNARLLVYVYVNVGLECYMLLFIHVFLLSVVCNYLLIWPATISSVM